MTEDNTAGGVSAWVGMRCLEVTQPIGTFYLGVIDAADLVRLSYADVRRIETERRDVETYLGIERPLSRARVAQIKDYVRTIDAAFPSSVIVAVKSEDTKYDVNTGFLEVRNTSNVAKVIDGQHRLAGLEDYSDGKFEVIVTIFVDMDIEEQAVIFGTINLEQTRVNKSLVYDLYEYAKQRSPQKTAHNIVTLLNSEPRSPFFGKIKILGTAGHPHETISQALFIDSLLPLMSSDPARDRDLLKRGRSPERATPAQEQVFVFRNMFLDRKDAAITRVLWNYFIAVEGKWGAYWREVKPGFVLNRTTGFRALMQFLPLAYLELAKPGEVPSERMFRTIFEPVTILGEEFTPDNYSPGASGQVKLRDQLKAQTGLG